MMEQSWGAVVKYREGDVQIEDATDEPSFQ